MAISFNRKHTPIRVYDGEDHVGNIRKASYGFYLELNGVYYAPDGRIRINSGGVTCLPFKTIRKAKRHALHLLSIIKVRKYSEPAVEKKL